LPHVCNETSHSDTFCARVLRFQIAPSHLYRFRSSSIVQTRPSCAFFISATSLFFFSRQNSHAHLLSAFDCASDSHSVQTRQKNGQYKRKPVSSAHTPRSVPHGGRAAAGRRAHAPPPLLWRRRRRRRRRLKRGAGGSSASPMHGHSLARKLDASHPGSRE
jgi:hypothetical protein